MGHLPLRWSLVPLVLAWASGAFPQTTGSIVGVVTDAGTGKPIAHALIVAKSRDGVETTIEADESGAYRLALPPGEYTLKALHSRYSTAASAKVVVRLDQSARTNFAIPRDDDWQLLAPPPPPPGAGRSVYNAVFAPTVASSRSTLFDAKGTVVRFFIGPPDAKSAVAAADWTVNPKLLKNKKNVPLVVTMSCPFCSGPRTQKRPITYYGANRSSTAALFAFTPVAAQLASTGGVGRIGFEVTRDGKQIDYLGVEVTVVHDGVKLGAEPARPAHAANLDVPKGASDIDLTLSARENGNTIEIQLQPNDPELAKLLHRKYLANDGGFRSLASALKVNELQPLLGHFYLDLIGAIENDTTLKERLSGSATAVAPPVADLVLGTEDEKMLVDLIGRVGGQLYAGLFSTSADPDLVAMMKTIQGYARKDRPLRIRIDTDGIYLPWQVLVPPGQISADQMWGFRYELSVSPTGVTLPGRYEGALVYHDGPWIFGRYRGTSPDDVVARLGALQLDALQSRLKVKGVVPIDSRGAFLQQLMASRRTVQVLMTFTHATSGTIIKADGSVSPDARGPSVQFANDDFLPVREVSALIAQVPGDERLLGNSPVVFLNGCETGTSGFFVTSNQDFAGTFLRLGARGVVVTEAPVWTYFGYTFGLKFLDKLKSGAPAPAALLQTRIDFLKAHNPLGLLYSYYGGPDVKVSFAP